MDFKPFESEAVGGACTYPQVNGAVDKDGVPRKDLHPYIERNLGQWTAPNSTERAFLARKQPFRGHQRPGAAPAFDIETDVAANLPPGTLLGLLGGTGIALVFCLDCQELFQYELQQLP